MRAYLLPCLWLALSALVSSCGFYKRDIIFRTHDEADKVYLQSAIAGLENNYRIRVNDQLDFRVFTNGGEILIDPNGELAGQLAKKGVNVGATMAGPGMGNGQGTFERPKYLVFPNGETKLPLVGTVQLEGLTLRQADSVLSLRYATFYQDAYVITKVFNRRVFVFTGMSNTIGGFGGGAGGAGGAVGGLGGGGSGTQAKIIKLENENTTLIEIMAEVGYIGQYTRMNRVRIIHGDLRNPQVREIDLQHIHTMAKADLTIRPNDIIYFEPSRRVAFDFLREFTGVTGLITSITSTIALIIVLSR